MDVGVERVRDSVDLLSYVVFAGVTLRKAGAQWMGLCPFHKERTPSFYVHPEKQVFLCRGCGASGDIFSFVERSEGVQFRAALQILASHAGIELDAPDAQQWASQRAERSRAEAWRTQRIEEIEQLRNDYLALYHAARLQIRCFGLTDALAEDVELGERYQQLDQVLDTLRNASTNAVLAAYRKEKGIE